MTENQKVYLRNIQKYLGISNPQIQADIDVISDIDSLDVQKAFLECILEFFYLQDGNEISDSQEECLGYFSVNKKHASVIEERVAHIYEILGPEGLADKYGFVPNATTVDDIQDHDPQNSPEDGEAINESKGTVEENDPSDSTCAKKPQESISGSQEGASSQPAGVTKNKRVGKNYGVRPGDAIRFWWSDTTFAIEKQINDRRRDRVQRSVAESKDIQEKLSSINNNTATIEETEKKP